MDSNLSSGFFGDKFKEIDLWTDGAYSSSDGVGGWAYIAIADGSELFRDSSYCQPSTNNIMELTAILEGLVTVSLKSTKTYKKYKKITR